MDSDSIQPEAVTPRGQRPRVPFAWLLVLVLAVWLSPLIPYSHNPRPDPRSAAPPAHTSSLEALAELRGDHRCLHQILKGNELIDAVMAGDEARARKALTAGADINARYVEICRYGYTALMEASFLGHESLVRWLLAEGADVNLERNGQTALYLAVRAGHQPIIKQLVAAGARQDPNQLRLTHLLIWASCKGFAMRQGEGFPLLPGAEDKPESAPSIREVLQEGADVNAADSRGFTPLMYAANLGLLDNVQTLVANGADVKRAAKDGSTAISLAERPESSVNREGRSRVVEYLRKVLAEK
jgi:hypothetical protein